MKYAQIQDNRVHWIFESDEKPDFAPYIQIVSLDGLDEVQEGWTYKDGFFSEYIEPFENLVLAKRTEIWNAGDNILSIVKSRFTQSEIESWPKQEQGAKDISVGNNDTDSAKFVIDIANQRGIETSVLVAKILHNVEYYGELSAKIIGEQQRLDDLIKKAEENQDRDLLNSIMWTYNPLG